MVVLAVSSHPDDIELGLAGTLILLQDAGCQIHYVNVANGCCGSMEHTAAETAAIRRREGMEACRIMGFTFHESYVDDLCLFYEDGLIRRMTALVREVKPDILLTLSLEDYMEDHMNAARVAVTAAFSRGIVNYRSIPDMPPAENDVMVYHSTPHILMDQMRRPLVPEFYVDIGASIDRKERMLACHASQKIWLDRTQGFDSYLLMMRENAEKMGRMSGRFRCAEGWRRHAHVGFSRQDGNPVADLLKGRCHFASA